MMREYISREAAINKLLQCADDYDPDYSDITVAHAISKIKEIPAADVVEVVRCKDCKYWIAGHISDNDTFYPPKCALVRDERSNDDFCSYGERREVRNG